MFNVPELRNDILISLGNIIIDYGLTKQRAEALTQIFVNFDDCQEVTEFGYFFHIFCNRLIPDVDYMPVIKWAVNCFEQNTVCTHECYYSLAQILKNNNSINTNEKKKYLMYVEQKNVSSLLVNHELVNNEESVYFLLKILMILVQKKKISSHFIIFNYVKKYICHSSDKVKVIVFRILKNVKNDRIQNFFTESYLKILIQNLVSSDVNIQKYAFKLIAELADSFPSFTRTIVQQGIFMFLAQNLSEHYNSCYFLNLIKFCQLAVEFCEKNSDEFTNSRLFESLAAMKYPDFSIINEIMFSLQESVDYKIADYTYFYVEEFQFS